MIPSILTGRDSVDALIKIDKLLSIGDKKSVVTIFNNVEINEDNSDFIVGFAVNVKLLAEHNGGAILKSYISLRSRIMKAINEYSSWNDDDVEDTRILLKTK